MGFWDKVREAVTGEAPRNQTDPVATFGASGAPAPAPEPVSPTPTARNVAESEPRRPEPVRTADSGSAHKTYTVRSGDTLSEIGAKFGVADTDIARLNKIKSPELIYPGQVFKIPSK